MNILKILKEIDGFTYNELFNILNENYKIALDKFSSEANTDTIKDYFSKFKELGKKNLINKDISYWIPKGWEKFKAAVDDAEGYGKSRTEHKRSKNAGKSITIHEDNRWLIVIPLDKDASCFHGRNTDWCTAKPTELHFIKYFNENNIILIYFIEKSSNEKYAISFNEDNNQVELFDKNDKSISREDFKSGTGRDPLDIVNLVEDEYLEKIKSWKQNQKQEQKEAKADIIKYRDGDYFKKDAPKNKIEHYLRNSRDVDNLSAYIRTFGSDNPEEDILMMDSGLSTQILGDKAPEKVKRAAINLSPLNIMYLDNPSEELQLMGIKSLSGIRSVFSDPKKEISDKVALAAIDRLRGAYNGEYLKDIFTPYRNYSEDVQIAAAKKYPEKALKYIINPTDKVKRMLQHKTQ